MKNSSSAFEGESGADELLTLYKVTAEDLKIVKSLGERVIPLVDETVDRWYEWMTPLPEFEEFLSDPATLARVKGQQADYWREVMRGEIDADYISKRIRVGEAHARIGLPLNSYFAGMNMFLEVFSDLIQKEVEPKKQAVTTRAIAKVLHLDTAVVVDTYSSIVEEQLTAQSRSLAEMSTPVTQIWSGILLLPIVGIIDSQRAGDIMNASLEKIAETQARIFILDISGVGVVDTAVANNLIKITKATKLMGCESTISGLSPAIAQTIVDLGIDITGIKTTSTMRDALSDAFHRVGMDVSRSS